MIRGPRQSQLTLMLQNSEAVLFRSRRVAVSAVLVGSVCMGSTLAFPHLFPDLFTSQYQAVRRNGYPVHPKPQLEHLLDKAMTDMEFSDAERDSVRIFSVNSKKCEVFGSVNFPNGAVIGIPAFFNAQSADEVQLEDLNVSLETKNENHKNIKKELKEISVLSDNAKMFAIADALAESRNSSKTLLGTAAAAFCFLGTFLQSSTIINYTHFKRAVFLLKLPVYFISAAMWFGTYRFICGPAELRNDEDRLNFLCGLGHYYLVGGIEYYDKVLTGNKLTNELHPNSYQSDGDFWYPMALPFSERLLQLEKKKETPSSELRTV